MLAPIPMLSMIIREMGTVDRLRLLRLGGHDQHGAYKGEGLPQLVLLPALRDSRLSQRQRLFQFLAYNGIEVPFSTLPPPSNTSRISAYSFPHIL
jgi:hypothetical protein